MIEAMRTRLLIGSGPPDSPLKTFFTTEDTEDTEKKEKIKSFSVVSVFSVVQSL